MDDRNLVEAYRARNTIQARAMMEALEDAGIRATMENDRLEGIVGELPMGWATAPRILVEDQDLPKAREILERIERAGTSPPAFSDEEETDEAITCLACGGRIPEGEGKCPACGWSYQAGDLEEQKP